MKKPLTKELSQEIYHYCLDQKRKKLYPDNFVPLLTVNITALLLHYGTNYKDIIFDAIDNTIVTDRYDFNNDPDTIMNELEPNQSCNETYGILNNHINFNKIPFSVDHTIMLNQICYEDFNTTIETMQHECTHLFHSALGTFERNKKTITYKWGFIEQAYLEKKHTFDHSSDTTLIEELFTTESAASQLRNWKAIRDSLKTIPAMNHYTAGVNFPVNYQSQFYSDMIEITTELRHNQLLWNELDLYALYQPGKDGIQAKFNQLLENENGFHSFYHNLKSYIMDKNDLECENLEPETQLELRDNMIHTKTNIKKQINTMNHNSGKQRR